MGLFYGRARFGKGKGSIAQIDYAIRTKQVYAAAIANLMAVMVIVTVAVSLVPGAALGGGASGVTFSAMPHIIWLMPTAAVVYFAVQALWFDSNADYTNTASWLRVGLVFMLVSGAVNLIHMVSLILEVNNLDSTFWLQSSGAWVIVLLVENILFMFMSVWLAWRMYVLCHDIVMGFQLGWRPGIAISEDELNAPLLPERDDLDTDNNDLESAAAASAPPPALPDTPSDAAGIRIGHAYGVAVGHTFHYGSQKKTT
jgi:hypothetical protein